MRRMISGGIAALLLTTGAPAVSQIWIGQVVGNMVAQGEAQRQEHACMMGTPMPASEVDETRGSTTAAMSAYQAALRNGGPGDARAAWHESDPRARWVHGRTKLRHDKLAAVTDPFLAAGARVDPSPTAYLRSGDGKLVQGYWVARDGDGNVVGTYDALFSRQAGVWKLTSLTLLAPTETPAALVQFCHKAGDVEPYKVAYAERQRVIEEKRAAKAAKRAAREAARTGK